MNFIFLVFVCCGLANAESWRSETFQMFSDQNGEDAMKIKLVQSEGSVKNAKADTAVQTVKEMDCLCDRYMARFLGLMLYKLGWKGEDEESQTASITMNIQPEQLNVLKAFASSSKHNYAWHDLDLAITILFSSIDKLPENYNGSYESYEISPKSLIFFVVCSFALLMLYWILIGLSPYKLISCGIVLIMSVSIAGTWFKEVELIQAERRNIEIPPHCNNPNMTYTQWLISLFQPSNVCVKYHKARIDPMITADFATILSKTVANLFVSSWSLIGTAYMDTVNVMGDEMFFLSRWLFHIQATVGLPLYILVSFLLIILSIIFCVMYCRTKQESHFIIGRNAITDNYDLPNNARQLKANGLRHITDGNKKDLPKQKPRKQLMKGKRYVIRHVSSKKS